MFGSKCGLSILFECHDKYREKHNSIPAQIPLVRCPWHFKMSCSAALISTEHRKKITLFWNRPDFRCVRWPFGLIISFCKNQIAHSLLLTNTISSTHTHTLTLPLSRNVATFLYDLVQRGCRTRQLEQEEKWEYECVANASFYSEGTCQKCSVPHHLCKHAQTLNAHVCKVETACRR